jgi:two-component system KDP operon response regulator KdpE
MDVLVISTSTTSEWWLEEWPVARVVSALGDVDGETRPDVVIADVRRVDGDSALVARAVSEIGAPVVVFGAVDGPQQAMRFLDAGAADYVTVTMSREEAVSRVYAAARIRPGHLAAAPEDAVVLGRVALSVGGDELWLQGAPVRLTPNEARLLRLLASPLDAVHQYNRLARAMWGDDPPDSAREQLRAYVRRLREKIEEDPDDPQILVTVPAHGYRLVVPREA